MLKETQKSALDPNASCDSMVGFMAWSMAKQAVKTVICCPSGCTVQANDFHIKHVTIKPLLSNFDFFYIPMAINLSGYK